MVLCVRGSLALMYMLGEIAVLDRAEIARAQALLMPRPEMTSGSNGLNYHVARAASYWTKLTTLSVSWNRLEGSVPVLVSNQKKSKTNSTKNNFWGVWNFAPENVAISENAERCDSKSRPQKIVAIF